MRREEGRSVGQSVHTDLGQGQGATGSEEEVMREGQASGAQATGRTGQGGDWGAEGLEVGRAQGVTEARSRGFQKSRAGGRGGTEGKKQEGEEGQSKEPGWVGRWRVGDVKLEPSHPPVLHAHKHVLHPPCHLLSCGQPHPACPATSPWHPGRPCPLLLRGSPHPHHPPAARPQPESPSPFLCS